MNQNQNFKDYKTKFLEMFLIKSPHVCSNLQSLLISKGQRINYLFILINASVFSFLLDLQ